jgi:hypothetical protein
MFQKSGRVPDWMRILEFLIAGKRKGRNYKDEERENTGRNLLEISWVVE